MLILYRIMMSHRVMRVGGCILLYVLLMTSNICAQDGEAAPVDGSLRLLGGQANGTGNVYIYHNGRWGVICDDGWDLNAAKVACVYLGFPYALGYTTRSYFGKPDDDVEVLLDDVQCHGDEETISDCQNGGWNAHNCEAKRETAGVFCAPLSMARSTTTSTTTTTTMTPSTPTPVPTLPPRPTRHRKIFRQPEVNEVLHDDASVQQVQHHVHEQPEPYEVRVVGGRNPGEGRVEVKVGGHWGTICSNNWSLLEAAVVCRQTSNTLARSAILTNHFGGDRKDKVFAGIRCDGEEDRLSDCFHEHTRDIICPESKMIAGVICTDTLPDLVPNATLLEQSTYLQDRPMYYLQCAMEENCASSSAYEIKNRSGDWHIQRRRLLRFSSSTWNFGTADFRPFRQKSDWEWHLCHMHYHSMAVFAHYDLLDQHGNRIAEGHKASFCLEDVECLPGVEKKYACKGFGDQGISVGCADNYLHDIDCQWIDITDVKPGFYVFKVHINPELLVAEMNYSNNAVTCQLHYTGWQVYVTDCQLGRG